MRTLHTSARPVSRQGTIVFDPRVPATPGFPSDVYGIMTQRSDSARPRPYAELDQALHTLGGYVLLMTCVIFRPGSRKIPVFYYSLIHAFRTFLPFFKTRCKSHVTCNF